MSTEQGQAQEACIQEVRDAHPPSLEEMDETQLRALARQLLWCCQLLGNHRDGILSDFEQVSDDNIALKMEIEFLKQLNELKTSQIKKQHSQIGNLREKHQKFQSIVNDMKIEHVENVDALRGANTDALLEIGVLRAANAAAQQEIAALRAANAAEPVGDVGP